MRLYNTMSRSKEELVPLVPGAVGMYVCGVTVYDLSHVGHARSAMVFDVIRRYLAFAGYRVRFVKNFTDVDDKIIRRASDEGVAAQEVSERFIAAYRADMDALGVLAPDVEPRATEHVPQMIDLIERLLGTGVAYAVGGDVYFAVRAFPRYGKLSGKNLDELLAGARVEVDERKRDPRDFALWKSAKPGEPSWESPWGPGRPGWHIECSAMSMQYLGESFDIHGGGEDLVFPHHECEIAQSEAGTGKPFARYWMHNGFVNLAAEKMSKSLGNTLTIRDLVGRHDPGALRLWLLGTHYRNPVEFSEDRVREAGRALERLRELVREARALPAGAPGRPDGGLPAQVAGLRRQFVEAMDDDFGTPQALASLFDMSRALNAHRDLAVRGERDAGALTDGVEVLVSLAGALGLRLDAGPARASADAAVEAEIARLVQERDAARRGRDWKRADELRDRLVREFPIALEDTPRGTRWKWKDA